MKNKCFHCLEKERIEGGMLCIDCSKLPKCEGCQVILGGGDAKASKTNPKRCESCLYYEERIDFKCQMCHKKIPLFYSPRTEILHFVVRGNFCGKCNAKCAIGSREITDEEDSKEYVGYLALMEKQMLRGEISQDQFEFACEMNPHDINRIVNNL